MRKQLLMIALIFAACVSQAVMKAWDWQADTFVNGRKETSQSLPCFWGKPDPEGSKYNTASGADGYAFAVTVTLAERARETLQEKLAINQWRGILNMGFGSNSGEYALLGVDRNGYLGVVRGPYNYWPVEKGLQLNNGGTYTFTGEYLNTTHTVTFYASDNSTGTVTEIGSVNVGDAGWELTEMSFGITPGSVNVGTRLDEVAGYTVNGFKTAAVLLPEPTALALLALGVAGLALRRRVR